MSGACRICGSATAPAFTTTDRNRRLSEDPFQYVRCGTCGAFALADVPDDLGAFYPREYYRLPSGRAELMASDLRAEWEKVDVLRRLRPGGRLLEIGPAIGAFLAVAIEAGYAAEAIEMDEQCCSFLREQLGVSAICSDDPGTVLSSLGQFDVIALWQVIEHLENPVEVMAAAAAALAPGGLLAVAAPNPQALQMRLFGGRWTHVDAPRHVHLLPLATVVQIGAENGLELALATTDDYSARGWNTFGWRESLANLVDSPAAARLLRLAGSIVSRLVAPLERRRHRGATYTAILRRPPAPS